MKDQEQNIYFRIADVIHYIQLNCNDQPTIDEVANKIKCSPSHLQRLFTEWAGVGPKKFLQYMSIEHAKKVLIKSQELLFDVALETGRSDAGRLHNLFIAIEGMTPDEYKHGGQQLTIKYSFAESVFGNIIVASTAKGICYLAFADNESEALHALHNSFPNATYQQMVDVAQQEALFVFTQDWTKLNRIKLHLKGTEFQLKVWETLLKIPLGRLSTYGNIAKHINNPKAYRAVGSAIGDNPVAFLIPCHRVIRSSGAFGGFRWGSTRKTAMIGWEAARLEI